MEVFGIDISTWQKGMDLNKAKNEGVNFAIIRGMYGNAKDVHFEENYTKAKNAGLGVGCYQWGRAKNEAQAKEEAEILINYCLKGKQFEYPIYYDVEDSILINLSVEELTKVITAWAETLENAGYYVGIYMNQSAFNNEVKGEELAKKYSQWRARWTTKANKPDCQMWQFGGETNYIRTNKIAGQVCDQDYAYVDFPSIIKNAGLNGFGNGQQSTNNGQQSSSTTNTTTDIKPSTYVVKKGDTLSGIASKYGTTYQKLASYNNIADPNKIYAGQVIQIPNGSTSNSSKETYIVKKGDTLSEIAAKYGTTYKKIASDNGIADPNKIYPGQKLIINK